MSEEWTVCHIISTGNWLAIRVPIKPRDQEWDKVPKVSKERAVELAERFNAE